MSFRKKLIFGDILNDIVMKTDDKSVMTTKELIKTAKEMVDRGFSTESPKYIIKQKRKILFHSFLNLGFAKKWFSFISQEENKWLTESRPRLFFKPFRVYLSTKWDKNRRLKVILDSYALANTNTFLRRVVKNSSPIKISEFILKDQQTKGEIYLGYNERFRKEGEFVASINCEQLGGLIYEVAFSIEREENGNYTCLIGCVQGNRLSAVENNVKDLQKLMYGLRPKALAIFIVQEIARQLGCSQILGTSNRIQAHNKKHFIHIDWLHKLSFDYNALWKEAGGEEYTEGWFKLPTTLYRKPMEEIKTHKRALYRNRYEMLDQISKQIAHHLYPNQE